MFRDHGDDLSLSCALSRLQHEPTLRSHSRIMNLNILVVKNGDELKRSRSEHSNDQPGGGSTQSSSRPLSMAVSATSPACKV